MVNEKEGRVSKSDWEKKGVRKNYRIRDERDESQNLVSGSADHGVWRRRRRKWNQKRVFVIFGVINKK